MCALQVQLSKPWPRETRGLTGDAKPRELIPLRQLHTRLAERNRALEAQGEPPLTLPEALGGRMYTGPLFVKYNAILRGFGAALEQCKGNTYTTSLHAINSCIVKNSKLTKATKVFRGISGGMLPKSFWEANDQGVRGGIEAAFMSTTYDRNVAMQYASGGEEGKPALVFEMQMVLLTNIPNVPQKARASARWRSSPPAPRRSSPRS